ncbi:MAG: lipase maturation factor family protein [Acidobacteria bacterium]|nr:lipase maturation factor family protein [Acidobacteriota bacterium]
MPREAEKSKPLLIWDADCSFCRKWIGRWQLATGDRVEYATSTAVGDRFPEIPKEEFARSVQLVETDGKIYRGAEAVLRALARAPGRRWALGAYEHVPGVAPISEAAYALVARNRPLFSRITQLLWGPDVSPPAYETARWLFVRMLAAVYLIAFASLAVQIEGLAGSRGVLPAAAFLDAVRASLGGTSPAQLPTIFWWIPPGDAALAGACWLGAVLSAVVMLTGLAPRPIFVALWALYLSLCSVVRVFLNFQWDILLLETGLLAVFLPAARVRTRSVFLLHWLLFRLMFTSGIVKLGAPTPEWRDLTALDFHYETQPLPTWTAWYMQRLPHAAQAASEVVMFAIELVAPWLIFAPRRVRHAGAAALLFLQVAIMATGNFAFFNLLTLALCVLLLDDTAWPMRFRRVRPGDRAGGEAGWSRAARRVLVPFAAVIFAVGTMQMTDRMRLPIPYPGPLRSIEEAIAPFRSVSSYGLFASMTTYRHEIVLQGSRDGATWLDYEFRFKPGDVSRPPRFVAPHQPRLDWQMWFAALGSYQRNPWVVELMKRLLEGSPPVVGLLERNPFPDGPPSQIRAIVYDYHMTSGEERRAGGAWWRREYLGPYAPTLTAPSR